MPKKITKPSYFKPDRYLSNSKIKDFQRDKSYFFHKHIICDNPEQKKGEPLLIGSAVDEWLTESEESFRKKYMLVSKRDTSNEFQLNPTQYKKIEDICKSVEETSAYKGLKGFKTQKILQVDRKIGEHFDGLKGMLDYLKIKDNKATIVDLKTSNNVDPNRYYWTCKNYNYFQQLAMYGLLVMANNPEVTEVEYRHLVVDTSNELYPVYAFKFDSDFMAEEIFKINFIIDLINKETEFKKQDTTWDDAIILGRVDEDNY